MHECLKIAAERDGLKLSLWVQQQMIPVFKREFPGITIAELMGTGSREPRPKLTPAQRVAIAKIEMVKTKKAKKTPKKAN
jgi:hypothetical protein